MVARPTQSGSHRPTGSEIAMAERSRRRLARYGRRALRLRVGRDGWVMLPAPAVRLLNEALARLAAGEAVSLVTPRQELTTQQAAQMLGVSRPFLVKQLESGELPFRKVGSHRRIRRDDVLAYKARIDADRHKALADLAAQAQELNMGY